MICVPEQSTAGRIAKCALMSAAAGLFLLSGLLRAQTLPPAQEYRHFYGICWDNTSNADALRYAKQMAQHFIMYKGGMESDTNAANMGFFLESPEYKVYGNLGVSRTLDYSKSYSAEEKATYEKWFPWKSKDPFPRNIATGWAFSANRVSVEPDWQQQAVIDYFVNQIITYAKSKENPAINFTFAGCAWDVPQLWGDFWDEEDQVGLERWTGGDSSYTHPGITHEYPTYSEGRAAFYIKLKAEMHKTWPNAKVIVEPDGLMSRWLDDIVKLPNRDEIVKDVFCVNENASLDFVTSPAFSEYPTLISHAMSGCTTPNADEASEHDYRTVAGNAAKVGSWYGWYGRVDGPNGPFSNVSHSSKLIRVLPNWDNLWGIPLTQRNWNDGTSVYTSPTSRADGKVICSRNPETGKIFAIFLNTSGIVSLMPSEHVISAQRTNNWLIESGDGLADLSITDTMVKLANTDYIGKCYIITTDKETNIAGTKENLIRKNTFEEGFQRNGRIELRPYPYSERQCADIFTPRGALAGRISASGTNSAVFRPSAAGAYLIRARIGGRQQLSRAVSY